MKAKRKLVNVIALFLFTTLFLCGCKMKNIEVEWSPELGNSTVFKVENEECSVNEFRLIVYNIKNQYTSIFGEQIWNKRYKSLSLEDYTKEIATKQLAKTKTMVLMAQKDGITLTEKEQSNCKKAAQAYYESLSEEEKKFFEMTEEDIYKLYSQYAIAGKLYKSLVGSVSEEVSDDDARVMIIQTIVVDNRDKVKEIQKKIDEGVDFSELADYYSKGSSAEIKLYRQDISDETYNILSRMEEGSVSEDIYENEKYTFYKIVSKIERDLTEENKTTILKERKVKAFDELYENYQQSISSSVNESVINEMLVDESSFLDTKEFYSFFSKYIDDGE